MACGSILFRFTSYQANESPQQINTIIVNHIVVTLPGVGYIKLLIPSRYQVA